MTYAAQGSHQRIQEERWPTERPLFALVLLISLVLWLVIVISVVGLLYAVALGAFFFVAHMAFVAHVRGSSVKLKRDQFPELYDTVARLSRQMEMERPEAYVMQSGGALNALATRFLGTKMIVLYSDLLEACGDNHAARDMIIAHELAHLKCGHLRWRWLTLPGFFIPFLGGALSRAREYTCDRYGIAGAGNADDSLRGLAILAAGPVFGPQVNLQGFVDQREEMNTGLMTLAEWLGSHPPLSKRIAALNPALDRAGFSPAAGRMRALTILGLIAVVLVGGGGTAASFVGRFLEEFEPAASTGGGSLDQAGWTAQARDNLDAEVYPDIVQQDFRRLRAFIEEHWGGSSFPESLEAVKARWQSVRGGEQFPYDPFDGLDYGYGLFGDTVLMWSSGPDRQSGTADDIDYLWPLGR